MSDDFFLTQNSARLMEDLVRDFESGAPLFLLYGESGIGKSRVLEKLREIGLADRRVHWLDFDEGIGDDESQKDRSEEVEELFASAAGRDIVIVDHFEKALQRTRHQLFVSWSTVGMQKQIGMIVASNDAFLDEFCQLAEQYQVPMNSTRQMPFGKSEVENFLGSYLFPNHLSGELTMPPPLRKQLAAIRGNPRRLIEFAERQARHIGIATPMIGASLGRGSRTLPVALGALVLLAGSAWYLFDHLRGVVPRLPAGDQVAVSLRQEPASVALPAGGVDDGDGGTIEAAAAQTMSADADDGRSATLALGADPAVAEAALEAAAPESHATGPAAPPEPAAERVAIAAEPEAPEMPVQPAGDLPYTPPVEAAQNESDATPPDSENRGEPVEVAMSDSGAYEQALSPPPVSWFELYPEEAAQLEKSAQLEQAAQLQAEIPASSSARFESDLKNSMDWISSRGDRIGTIQILLLSQDKFDADNFYGYVAGLSDQQVDPRELRVFPTYTGNAEVYSVVYGEFESRAAALRAIDDLPPALRDAGPLARSVGGLWQEIRRLESKN